MVDAEEVEGYLDSISEELFGGILSDLDRRKVVTLKINLMMRMRYGELDRGTYGIALELCPTKFSKDDI